MNAWEQYAFDIENGTIPACKRVKQAVKRYFNDLNNPLYVFDSEVVERFIVFSRHCPHVKGHLRGKPIMLESWQQFAFANLFGFKVKATGRRKYRSAYIQVPRKNAKSTVAAILANWFLVMESGQQDIYTAAVSRDQARIVFDDARQMCLLSKPLKKRVSIQQHKITYPKSNSLLKPLAAKAATIEGTNPSLAIVDEYHLHPDNAVYSALELGMGARPEGILFAITTAGSNVISACKQHYDYCCQILDGEEYNASLFALIYELDDEHEIDNEALWIKANPNLNISVDSAALHDTIQKSRGIPSQWTEMLTKRFNIWCQGETLWMGEGAWKACQLDYDENDLKGLECYAGLDLSSTGDITSICYTFPVDNELLLLTRHYLPEAQLQNPANKNRAVYRQWVQAGWIRTTVGDCIDYDRIRDDILKDSQHFDIKLVGFDTWSATHLRTQLQGAGLDVLNPSRKPICALARCPNLPRCSLIARSFVTTTIRCWHGRCPM
ncbi:terminase [Xenorhabdus vietnamensis]|uniref:Terminase n=1 Tax=Xenorhabdus vietnamensis TaxID=351656 RepID=A0A1Y2SIR6_9GAMM|nr:terminase [Xenorhabdus vietnamensis]